MPDVAKAQDDIQRAGSRRNGREVHGQRLWPWLSAKAVYGYQPDGRQDQNQHHDQAPPEQQGFRGEPFDLQGFRDCPYLWPFLRRKGYNDRQPRLPGHRFLQGRHHLPHPLETVSGVLGQGFQHHLLHRLRDVGVDATRHGQGGADVLHDDGHGGLSLKRHPTGQHFVEHDPQRVNVAPFVSGLAFAQFRRHVGRCA